MSPARPESASRTPVAAALLLCAGALPCGAPALAADGAERVRVAFVGDQGIGDGSRAVLSMLGSQEVDLLVLLGDLGYEPDSAAIWETQLNDALGPDFPVISVVGNHEDLEWPTYRRLLAERLARTGGALRCDGQAGVKALCRFANLDIVQVAPGIADVPGVQPWDGYASFIAETFAARPADRWRLCTWHLNQHVLQTGDKGDGTGWSVYDACLDAGAMVVVAHEHAYSRSHLMSDYRSLQVADRDDDLILEPGRSLVAVSGLGGHSIREQKRGGDWWASIHTATQGATHGALLCDFGQRVADCRLRTVDGNEPDRFTLRLPGAGETQRVRPVGVDLPLVFSRTDTEEYRWIDVGPDGRTGSTWIGRECAERLGGATRTGDWRALMALAPAGDTLADPCVEGAAPAARTAPSSGGDAPPFVFARTDTEEYRWIDVGPDGRTGSTWISRECAERSGGAARTGDWWDLMALAPALDAVEGPC